MFHVKHTLTYHNVPRETFESIDLLIANNKENLEGYLNLLLWWNKRINLVSRSVSRETLQLHIQHSILLTEIPGFKQVQKVVDAGTGGGLPGIPLAIVNPHKEFILNDIVSKKMMAAKQMARKLDVPNITVLNDSIADVDINHPFCLISKHAFKIDDLHQMADHLPWQKMIFYKGTGFKKELDNIKEPLQIDVYHLFKGNQQPFYEGKVLVVISK